MKILFISEPVFCNLYRIAIIMKEDDNGSD
jgi:hypothetical protein